jgi:hypothetical protein
MVVIPLSTFEKPKEVLLTIRRGTEWQTKPARMSEDQALKLASECRKRGLVAEVNHGSA